MTIYILLLLICIVAFLRPEKKSLTYVALGALFVVSAFRHEMIGTDTSVYMDYLYRANYLEYTSLNAVTDQTQSFELLTNSIYLLMDTIKLPDRFIIVFFSTLTIFALPIISKRYNVCLPLLILAFYLGGTFIYSLNIARQICAITWVVVGYSWVHDENIKKSILFFAFVAFGASLHFSTIVLSILYCMRYINIGYKKIISLFIPVALMFASGLLSISSFLKGFSTSFLEGYQEQLTEGSNAVGVFGLFRYFAVLGLQLYLLKFIEHKYMPVIAMSLLCSVSSLGVDSLVSRALMGFEIYSILLLPFLYSSQDITFEKYKNQAIVFLLLNLIYSFFTTISGNPLLVPYKFCEF